MDTNFNKYLKQMIFLIVLMFGLIFVTVFLTGGRETYEFTRRDIIVFIVFILSEIATCIALFVVVVKIAKVGQKNVHVPNIPRTKYEKIIQRRGYFLAFFAFLLALGIMVLGVTSIPYIDLIYHVLIKRLLIICVVLSILLIPLNLFLRNQLLKKINNTQVQDIQNYIYSHRDSAEEMAEKKYRQLCILRFLSDFYAIVIAIVAMIIAFCTGVIYTSDIAIGLCMLSAILFLTALSRFRFPTPQTIFRDDEHYVDEADYPYLYMLTRKAAKTLNCNGEIRIAILDNFNAGIARIGNTYSIQLGVLLLNVVSQDELYCILLHEFSHMASEYESANKVRDYHTWLQQGTNPHFLSGIATALFFYLDTMYILQFSLYQYASTLSVETYADASMANYSDKKTAASALLKLKFYELFSWEKGTYDEDCFFESETAGKDYFSQQLNSFIARMNLCQNDWRKFVEVEILSRNASHPTLKMRLETLGVSSFELIDIAIDETYKAERKKALQYMEELFHNELIKVYEDTRKNLYLQPKALVESWEANGKPVVAAEYSDVGFALRQLGRNTEALELYHRAISELTLDSEVCHARYIRGCYLLHQFDDAGLADIYYAIEHNTNYIDEGLDVIGKFCCLTGNQEELDIFRKKAIELAQKQKDVYTHISTLSKKDTLVAEQLPDGMLDDILSYILSIDEGTIEKIYLVRKVITEDFFTSVFIIKFTTDAPSETQDNVMHKIFSYLDTCSSWQFSLFEYTEIRGVKIDKMVNSCVYHKNSNQPSN